MLKDEIILTRTEEQLFELIHNAAKKIPNRRPEESIFIFGGWVRDKLLGKPANDYDVLISKPILKEFLKALKASDLRVSIKQIRLDEYPKIGQLLHNINIKDLKIKMGVTTLEIDIERELASKDFTVNSLCYDVLSRSLIRNRVTNNGRSDLEKKILRTSISVELTLKQAPSRIIRMIRFALDYGFKLDDDIIRYFNNTKLRQIVHYYTNSFFNQLRKLSKFIDMHPEKLRECLILIDMTRITDLVSLCFDYKAKRIVIFFVKHNLNELKTMIINDQLQYGDHYVSIRLELKDLVKHQQFYIKLKNRIKAT